jgi:hypothetical protein
MKFLAVWILLALAVLSVWIWVKRMNRYQMFLNWCRWAQKDPDDPEVVKEFMEAFGYK